MNRKTIFSPDRMYRYTLWREWDIFNPDYAMFIGLNPSTADEIKNDPTVRRCIGFAKDWGYGALCMTNAFAYRATDPREIISCALPIGSENDKWLVKVAKDAGIVIAAWGVNGSFLSRDKGVLKLLHNSIYCLGKTKDGYPRHPLYVYQKVQPQVYE